MIRWLQHRIRVLALWLTARTGTWVVPKRVRAMIDANQFEAVGDELVRIDCEWFGDPEIRQARSFMYLAMTRCDSDAIADKVVPDERG